MSWITSCSGANSNMMNSLMSDMQPSDWSWGNVFMVWSPPFIALVFLYLRIGNTRDRYSVLKRDLWQWTPLLWALFFFGISVLTIGLCIVVISSRASLAAAGWTYSHTGVLIVLLILFVVHLWHVEVLGSCNSNGIRCGCPNTSGCWGNNGRSTGFSQWGSSHGFNFPVLMLINFLITLLQLGVAGWGGIAINSGLITLSIPPIVAVIFNIVNIGYLWSYNRSARNEQCRQSQSINGIPTYTQNPRGWDNWE
jgi:hypothetical protein